MKLKPNLPPKTIGSSCKAYLGIMAGGLGAFKDLLSPLLNAKIAAT
jgi:hypothetical protein